ncbi:sulfatase-like hydrolase/transferase [Fertoebacter nigrum]|uniref:Sulfatase-like hydrolase/transferase n=1 Tax=Fertoeibacter niger TaxID=2656921 RepID=A0A8X8GW41_9RHOB|nr:sulfatase-like hydrolase/transferase [Fertoeibacter niger]NUB45459.1 sulfatase-like hydrolase/transferase [Fertoeibacter niger]
MARPAPRVTRRGGWPLALRLALAALVLHLVLVQPNHPGAMTPQALLLFPLELPVILLLLLALPGSRRASRAVRLALVVFLTTGAAWKAADLGMFVAFGRGFDPLVDGHLLAAGVNLGAGSLGLPQVVVALLAMVASLAVVVAVAGLQWWALAQWARVGLPRAVALGAGLAACLAGGVAVAEAGQARRLWSLPVSPPGAAFTARLGWERVVALRNSRATLLAFRAAALDDPFASGVGLLDRLGGRDVLVIFVESYGRSSFDTPFYAETHAPFLRAAEAKLAAAGLQARSAWLTSPITGGQSWLAHATLASGLMIGNQQRYRALLASPRRSLWQIAGEAGYRTAAIMPAITMDWPEGERLGFGQILAAADMGYRGKPFNWVTMPDQFTLARGPGLLAPSDRPLMAQIVLISSHAPWVPVPRLLDWEALGDGRVFDAMATAGDAPDVVWRDRDRVRAQYRLSLDYALETVMEFAARQGPDAPLMLVLGDHQAAGFVAQNASRDVPLHVIGPAQALAPMAEWGFAPGLFPAAAPVWPMAAFRNRFLRSYSSAAPSGGT